MTEPVTHYFPSPEWTATAARNIDEQDRLHAMLTANATLAQAQSLASLSHYYPNVSPGVLTASAMAGIPAGDPAMTALALQQTALDAEADKDDGSLLDLPWTFVKGGIRNGFAFFQSLWEETIAHPLRMAVMEHQKGRLFQPKEDPWNMASYIDTGFSPGVQAVAASLQGQRANLGSGFLPRSDVAPETQQALQQGVPLEQAMANQEQMKLGIPLTQLARQEAETSVSVSRHGRPGEPSVPVSPGRLLAIQFMDPGTLAFKAVSGTVDLAANIVADPANIALSELARTRKILSAIVPETQARTGAVVGRTMSEALDSREGQAALDTLFKWNQEQSGESFAKMYEYLRSTQKGMPQPILAERLMRPGITRGEIKQVLMDASSASGAASATLGMHSLTPVNMTGQLLENAGLRRAGTSGPTLSQRLGGAAFGDVGRLAGFGVGARVKMEGTYMGKLMASVGARSLSFDDLNQGAEDLRGWLQTAGYSRDEIGGWLRRYAEAGVRNTTPDGVMSISSTDGYKLWSDLMDDFGKKLVKDGVPEPVVKNFVAGFSTQEDLRKYFTDAVGNARWFPGSRTMMMRDGTVEALPSAHLISQFLERGVPMIPATKVRSALRKADLLRFRDATGLPITSRVDDWGKLGDHVMTNLADWYMTKVWKPAVLLRVAWPIRVVGEEQFRQAAVGLDGMFTHPFQYFAWVTGRKGNKAVLRTAFEESKDWQASQSRKAGGWIGRKGPRSPYTGEWVNAREADPRYAEGVVNEMVQLATDSVAPHVFTDGSEGLKVTKDWFWDGDGQKFRYELMRDGDRWGVLQSRANSDAYIDSIYINGNILAGAEGRSLNGATGQWTTFTGHDIPLANVPDVGGGARQLPEPNFRATGPAYSVRSPAGGADFNAFLDDQFGEIEDALVQKYNIQASQSISSIDPTERIEDAIDAISVSLRDNFGKEGDDAARELEQIAQDFIDRYNKGTLDPNTELLDFEDGVRAVIHRHVTPGASQPEWERIFNDSHAEFIPIREALAAGEMTREEIGAVFSSIGEIGNMRPVPVPKDMVDGVYLLPKSSSVSPIPGMFSPIDASRALGVDEGAPAWSAIVVRNGNVEGVVSLGRNGEGAVDKIHLLSHVGGDKAGSDLFAMFKKLMNRGDIDAQDMLKLMLSDGRGGQMNFLQFLRTAAMRDLGIDTTELHTVHDVVDAIRKSGIPDAFSRIRPPAGAEEMTRHGAEAFGTMVDVSLGQIRRNAKTGQIRAPRGNSIRADNWPEHRLTYQFDKEPDPEIIEALSTGSFRGHDMRSISSPEHINEVKRIINDEFKGRLKPVVRVVKEADRQTVSTWDKMVDYMMNMLMSKPTNYLSRSPVFKQKYWERIAQLFPYMKNEVREQVLRAAEHAGLSRGTLRGFLERSLTGSERQSVISKLDEMAGPAIRLKDIMAEPLKGIESLDIADDIAKAFALHETKDLLYDMTRKHNFFDMTRNLFPFGEAWLEIFEVWSKIMRDHPNVIRRLQQGINGLHSSGIVYEDPNTGEDVFNYPGGGLLGNWMFNKDGSETSVTPQPTARLAGLNIALGAYMPGVGPLVQVPVSNMGFIEKPANKWIKDMLLPFGAQKIDNLGSAIETLTAPTWLKKAMIAIGKPSGDGERLYNNTVIDVYKSLLLTGKYDKNDKASAAAALEKAKSYAHTLWAIRTASAFIGPTGATFRFDTNDKDGKVWAFQALSSEYRDMLDKADFDHQVAFTQFTKRFGLDPTLLYPSKSRTLVRRSTTTAGARFEAENPDLFKQMPLTAYYARPDDVDGEFDYSAYLNQLANGTRQGLSPKQWAQERNDFLGRIAYERARMIVGDRKDDAADAWLRSYRLQLMEDYPGYNDSVLGIEQGATRDQVIREFYTWRDSPDLLATRAGRGLRTYLALRDEVSALGVQMGLTDTGFRSAKRTKYLRDWLRANALRIVQQYPAFGPMWEQVFSREIEEPKDYSDTLSLMGQEIATNG